MVVAGEGAEWGLTVAKSEKVHFPSKTKVPRAQEGVRCLCNGVQVQRKPAGTFLYGHFAENLVVPPWEEEGSEIAPRQHQTPPTPRSGVCGEEEQGQASVTSTPAPGNVKHRLSSNLKTRSSDDRPEAASSGRAPSLCKGMAF